MSEFENEPHSFEIIKACSFLTKMQRCGFNTSGNPDRIPLHLSQHVATRTDNAAYSDLPYFGNNLQITVFQNCVLANFS